MSRTAQRSSKKEVQKCPLILRIKRLLVTMARKSSMTDAAEIKGGELSILLRGKQGKTIVLK